MPHNVHKMHGAGNDFLVVDNRSSNFPSSPETIRQICSRNRGLGADGVLLISNPTVDNADLQMTVINSDGSPAEMCGNGLRCAALYAHRILGLPESVRFQTGAGILHGQITESGEVTIDINLVKPFISMDIDGSTVYFGDTGVPHAVLFPEGGIGLYPLAEEGAHLRRHEAFAPAGTNVDIAEILPNGIVAIRTFERGVEAETEACGTGAAAVAICACQFRGFNGPVAIRTRGGDILTVDTRTIPVQLTGPATFIARCELFI